MVTANTYGRQVVVPLVNKSGGSVAAGDVVVVDTSNNDAFTTSTAGAVTIGIGVAQETIASNATGRILLSGYAALVNTSASVTRGNFGKTHTVVKQAVDAGASRVVGTFCQFLTGGTTPDAIVFPSDLGGGSGLVDPMTTRGDVIVRNASNVSARLAVGATANMALRSDGTDVGYAILPGTLLGKTSYTPGSDSDIKSSTSTTLEDVDATNAIVTFTAPASGNVIVDITANAQVTGSQSQLYWGVRESSTNVGAKTFILGIFPQGMRTTARWYITGISAGAHTYKAAICVDAQTGHLSGGPTLGPIVLAVWAA